jgi:HEXXH motif-containing protein
MFAALAAGGGGTPAAALLAAGQRSKRMLLHRAVLDHSQSAGPEGRELARGYDLLAGLQRRSPQAAQTVERVTGYPAVTAWAAATLRALVRRDAPLPDPDYLSAVAASAAVRAGVDIQIPVRVRRGRVLLPSLGAAQVAPSSQDCDAVVQCGPQGASVAALGSDLPIPSEPNWSGLRQVTVSAFGLHLDAALDDVDPFNVPAGSDLRRLGNAEADRWHSTLQAAWSLLARHHRTSAAEMPALLGVLVPLETAEDRQVSATSRDAFGAVALSEPPNATSLAETLIHEVQHLKLGALLDLVPLLSDDGEARWYAPWRDDPRPLSGLLQGAYAHLGVAGFWLRQRWLEASPMYGHVRFARWREQTWEVVQTLLDSGALTPEGHVFVRGMGTTLDGFRREPVPQEAVEQAHAAAGRHRRAWELRRAGARITES